MAATSLLWAGSLPLYGLPAAAATGAEVTVSPQAVSPTDQYYTTTHALEGTGAVVTVKVGPNKVLRPNFPVEVQECDVDPSSADDCDMLTTLDYDQLTKQPVLAKANGSVTVHFLLWSPLPNKWDPASVIKVGPGDPAALWIGDDPSNWAGTGVVSAPVPIKLKEGRPRPRPSSRAATGAANTGNGSGTGTVVPIVLAVLVVFAGSAVTIGRRRRAIAG
jgi:hypothetical protein